MYGTCRPSTRVAVRAAALVDLENTVIYDGLRIPCCLGRPLLDLVRERAQGMPTRVATGQKVLREYMPALAGLGWGLTPVSAEPDAADMALIEVGYAFIRCGITDLLVVSGDHAFVELAPWARLHVIAHAGHLSRRLRLAATTVTYLPPIASVASSTRTAA